VYCEDWAFEHGYDLVKRGKTQDGRWGYVCGRGGKTQNNRKIAPEDLKRRSRSRKCGCNFKLWIVKREEEDEETWSVRHYQKMEPHNHDPTLPGTAVTNDRRKRRDEAIQSRIIDESDACVSIPQIHALLRQNYPSSFQTRKDIANVINQARATRHGPTLSPTSSP
jgi:primase-polymerase (primpol)-like protein